MYRSMTHPGQTTVCRGHRSHSQSGTALSFPPHPPLLDVVSYSQACLKLTEDDLELLFLLSPLPAGIIGMFYTPDFMQYWGSNPRLEAC